MSAALFETDGYGGWRPSVDVSEPCPAPKFDGADYDHSRDAPRLSAQLQRVYDLMEDGHWRTLAEISSATNDPPASVSAQLRHLRKERFGGHTVDRRHRGDKADGLYEYRLTIRVPQ